MDFSPFLGWVDVLKPSSPPAGARKIGASDLLRYENALSQAAQELGLLNGAGQRGYTVSQTAGRTVTVWDYLNNREQLIYGNTGVRNVYSLLEGATFTGGRVEVIREGNSVELTIHGITPSANISNGSVAFRLPSGFRPQSYQLFPNAFYGIDSTVGNRALMSGGGALQVYGWTTTSTVYARLSWKTLDPWPTSLPGVAA